MYPISLYKAFVALRKQIYRVKTRTAHDRYSKIEYYKREFKTYRKFCDEADAFIYAMDKDSTVQEIFDDMLTKSQSKHGILRLCY